MPRFGAMSVSDFVVPSVVCRGLTSLGTSAATKLVIGAYIGVPASTVCVLHRLYTTVSAPDSLPEKVGE